MNDVLKVSVDTNKKDKKDRHKDIHFTVRISHEELRYFNNMISILYNLKVNRRPVLKSMSLPSFCKMTLHFFCNNYRNNVFSDNHVVDNIDTDDLDTFEKFIAFRVKYMNYSLDKQIEDLKKEGYLE